MDTLVLRTYWSTHFASGGFALRWWPSHGFVFGGHRKRSRDSWSNYLVLFKHCSLGSLYQWLSPGRSEGPHLRPFLHSSPDRYSSMVTDTSGYHTNLSFPLVVLTAFSAQSCSFAWLQVSSTFALFVQPRVAFCWPPWQNWPVPEVFGTFAFESKLHRDWHFFLMEPVFYLLPIDPPRTWLDGPVI